MKRWLNTYEQFVRARQPNILAEPNSIEYWKTQFFYTLLIYGLPISLLATLPGIYLSVAKHDIVMCVVDLATFSGFTVITFAGKVPTQARKVLLIALFYPLAVYLITAFGYIGPGVFYLFGLTVISALILSEFLVYCNILLSTLILVASAVLHHPGQYQAPHITSGSQIAFAFNFVFLSTLSAILILRVLNRLRQALLNNRQLIQHYQMLFDKSPLPMWVFDTQTLQFKDVNEAAKRHYGYTQEEFMDMKITDIRSASDSAALLNTVQANRISGLPYEQYARHYKKNGELIDVHIESSLLIVDDTRLRLVLANDVTELIKNQAKVKAANEAIQRSEADLRAIFESTVEGIVLIDEFDRIKQFNARATEYFRFNHLPQEFEAGQNIFSYLPRLLQDDFKQLLFRTKAGETIEYDRHYSLADADMWIHYSLNPVFTGDTVAGVCITGRDITPVKTYITKIEDQNNLFREIAWTQSHIVRAPVARLLGLLNLVQQPGNQDELRLTLQYIVQTVTELDETVTAIIYKSHEATSMTPLLKNDKK